VREVEFTRENIPSKASLPELHVLPYAHAHTDAHTAEHSAAHSYDDYHGTIFETPSTMRIRELLQTVHCVKTDTDGHRHERLYRGDNMQKQSPSTLGRRHGTTQDTRGSGDTKHSRQEHTDHGRVRHDSIDAQELQQILGFKPMAATQRSGPKRAQKEQTREEEETDTERRDHKPHD
jgi:hypothetical protein